MTAQATGHQSPIMPLNVKALGTTVNEHNAESVARIAMEMVQLLTYMKSQWGHQEYDNVKGAYKRLADQAIAELAKQVNR